MKNKKNILFISLDENLLSEKVGDALNRQKEISKYFEILTVIVHSKKRHKVKTFDNLRIIPTNSSNMFFGFFKILSIIRKEKKKKILYDSISTQDPFFLGIVGYLGSKILKTKFKPQVHTEITNPYWRNESFLNNISYYVSKFIFKVSYSVRTVNPKVKEMLDKKGIKNSLIPVFVDIEKYKNIKTEKKYDLLFVGRLVKEKNLFFLLDVVENIVHNKKINLKTAVVGTGFLEKQLRSEIKKRSLENNVELLGAKTSTELNIVYSKSKILILPSIYEGWGLVVLEASLCGTPVIMSDTGCSGSVIKNDLSGKTCKINDLKCFTTSIVELLKDEKKQKDFSQNAKNIIMNDYSKDLLKEKLVIFLDE